MSTKNKILYAASTASHLKRFHGPYIEALNKQATVKTLADGEGVDFCVPFHKSFFSLSNLKSIRRIRKILVREQFDLILVHTTLAAFLVRMATVGMKRRPYIKNVVHGYLFPRSCKGLRNKVLLLCEKLLAGKTDEIIVMNQEDLDVAKEHRLCRGSVHFIFGMGLPEKDPVKADADLKGCFAKDPSDLLCTFVGELSGRKNQAFLIRAVKRLREDGIPVQLLLLGEGANREELGALIASLSLEEHVFLPGNVENVPDYLAVTDLYVSASNSEGLPFNLLEAMDMGLPILASATKGQTDLLGEEQLYPHGDTDAFCKALRRIYASGNYGTQSVSYPQLLQYRLSSVFDENLNLFLRVKDESN